MSYYEKNKENLAVIGKFITEIQNNWTWGKLTLPEQENFKKYIVSDKIINLLKYSFTYKWSILNNLYSIYLEGLGYTPTNWR